MAKGNYQCTKCGLEGISKCRFQRSFFFCGEKADYFGVLSNLFSLKIENELKEPFHMKPMYRGTLTVGYLHSHPAEKGEVTVQDAFTQLVRLIKSSELDDGFWKQFSCDHNWQPTSVCDFGCCKPPKKKK